VFVIKYYVFNMQDNFMLPIMQCLARARERDVSHTACLSACFVALSLTKSWCH
jgi:hypothetical protein